MNKVITVFVASFLCTVANAQLNARVTVVANQVGNYVNKSAFTTLQTSLNNFINNRTWTTESFKPNEKIDCNFLLNIQPTDEQNVYTASLTIQSARPAFNSTYNSPIVNFKDDDIVFKYQEFQQIEFNDNRVMGSDVLVANLPAVMAYYAYMIIGLDYNSFSLKGGEPYFLKAQNIINNAPDGRGIKGWKPFDGIRSRYWLTENLLNSRYAVMHEVYYSYYRQGMDKMYTDIPAARASIIQVLELLEVFNQANPNTMINQFFFQGKATELIKIFSKATPAQKVRALELLTKLDITNLNRYKDEIK